MNIKIETCEVKTSSKGTPYKRVTLTDESGKKFDNVAVFSFYREYDQVSAGSTVEGVIETKDFNGKPSHSLVNGNLGKRPSSISAPIKKAMDMKAENIEKAQVRKSDSIAWFNSTNSAIALFSAIYGGVNISKIDENNIKDFITQWRDWFLAEYEKTKDVTNQAPF